MVAMRSGLALVRRARPMRDEGEGEGGQHGENSGAA